MTFSPFQESAVTPFEWRITYNGRRVGVVPFTTGYIVTTADLEFATNLLSDFLFDFLNTNSFSYEPILIELVQLDCDRRISEYLDSFSLIGFVRLNNRDARRRYLQKFCKDLMLREATEAIRDVIRRRLQEFCKNLMRYFARLEKRGSDD